MFAQLAALLAKWLIQLKKAFDENPSRIFFRPLKLPKAFLAVH